MPYTKAYTSDTLHIKYFLANDNLVHQSKLFYEDLKDPLSIQNGKYKVFNSKRFIKSIIQKKYIPLMERFWQLNANKSLFLEKQLSAKYIR